MSFPLPSVTPPVLQNWQMQYGGLTFGADTPYAIDNVEGLDLPAVRNGDVARPRDTGEFIGLDLLGGRTVTIDLDSTSDGTSLQSALTALAGALIPPPDGQTESPLWVQLPNLPLLAVSCRVRKRQLPIDLPWSTGSYAKKIIVELHATDPRVYAPSVASIITLSAPTGGLTFDATPSFTFGSGGVSSATINNTGNIEMRPLITFTGPVTNPAITNQTLGLELSFSNPNQIDYTLNAGDKLVVDTDQHQATYYPSGSSVGSSRRNWLVAGSTWWDLPPGSSTLQFDSGDASLPTPAPTCEIDWAPAYVSAT